MAGSLDYCFSEYVADLLGLIVWVNQDYQAQLSLLTQLRMTAETCEATYVPLLKEVKQNFKNMQTESIGAPDKILIMLLEKLIIVLKKFPKELSGFLPGLIESFTNLTDKSLGFPEGIDQRFSRADGVDIKCLKAMLETIKAGELGKALTQHCFKVLFRLLFVGTPHEHKILKCK